LKVDLLIMRVFWFFLFVLLLSCHEIVAQKGKIIFFGQVTDSLHNESIPFVHVLVPSQNTGTITDSLGFFKLELKNEEKYNITFHHTAFNTKTISLSGNHKQFISISLSSKNYQTEEVVIKSNKQSMVDEVVPGKIMVKQKEILLTPNLLGEADLVRTLQLMPGIQSVNEGNSGIYVRGGSPGHNYIVFDDMELLNPSHLMGIYSVFNPLSVDHVAFYKGNAPIHESSRLASSIIVNSKNEKKEDFNIAANIGNISSNINIQGESAKQKWYYNVGFRRSYLELIQEGAKLFLQDADNYFLNNKFGFYDFNGKVVYKYTKGSLALAWYKGNDDFNFSQKSKDIKMGNAWGNEAVSLTWKQLLNQNTSLKNSFSYSGYNSTLLIDFLNQGLSFSTSYAHYQHKIETLISKAQHSVRFGANTQYRIIEPNSIDLNLSTNNKASSSKYKYIISKWFLSDEFKVLNKLNIYVGAGIDYYYQLDKLNEGYTQNTSANSTKDKADFLWNGVFTFGYQLPDDNSVKGSYGITTQNIHLSSIASIPLPSDVWMPATRKVPAEFGQQITLGYFKRVSKLNLEYGIEGYAKFLNHQQLLKVNVEGNEINDFEDNFMDGRAKSYGTELSIKMSGKKFTSNISYTLGWVKQKFPEINQGKWHDAKYDRRHDINVLNTFKISNRADIGFVFIFATGNKATLPVGRYWMMGQIANDYEGVNNYRMPVYHRADLSLNYHLKSDVFKESILNFSIINILNRSNPYFVYFDIEEGEKAYELSIAAKQVSLFPIMPSVSWKVKF